MYVSLLLSIGHFNDSFSNNFRHATLVFLLLFSLGYSNQLSGAIPDSIGNLTNLHRLYVTVSFYILALHKQLSYSPY